MSLMPPGSMLYEINTRIVLGELGPQATLDDLPDTFLDRLAEMGFTILWMMGAWQTGPAGRAVSRSRPEWRRGFEQELSDLKEDDICGSPYAVQAYTVHADFGGPEALARLRQRLRQRGLKLLLDFVPNHTALDHGWTQSHPEFYIPGTETDLARQPDNYCRVLTGRGPAILAHGRDPYFPGWPDTLQLNYRHAGLQAAMMAELEGIAQQCDGVRCDMAMLLLPDVFQHVWGDQAQPRDSTPPADRPFWPDAIARVRQRQPDFLFLAEVYWDLEWAMIEQGFDCVYDKRLYDRLRDGRAAPVRAHLNAPMSFQRRCARFLENHDERRAAAVFLGEVHKAAAVVTYFTPGLRFLHEGQLEGRRAHASVHLARRRREPADTDLAAFYQRLLANLKRPEVQHGRWQLFSCRTAWEDNPTWDQFIAFGWEGANGSQLLATIHYGPTRGQCYVEVPFPRLRGKKVLLRDLFSHAQYEREGDELCSRGLYLDLPPWGYHLFEVLVQAE